jgi:hypothetical protein
VSGGADPFAGACCAAMPARALLPTRPIIGSFKPLGLAPKNLRAVQLLLGHSEVDCVLLQPMWPRATDRRVVVGSPALLRRLGTPKHPRATVLNPDRCDSTLRRIGWLCVLERDRSDLLIGQRRSLGVQPLEFAVADAGARKGSCTLDRC